MLSNEFDKNIWWFKKTYTKLIAKGKSRGLDKTALNYYTEVHHIVPKCVNGTNEDKNLVLLTYREHVIAHMLLARIYNTIELKHVVNYMLSSKKNTIKIVSTKFIDEIKEASIAYIRELRKKQVGQRYSDSRKLNISKSILNKQQPITDETRGKISIAHGRRIMDPQGRIFPTIGKCAEANNTTRRIIDYNLKNRPESGYKYLDPPKVRRVIDPDGEVHSSIRACAIKYNRNGKTIKNWIENYPEFNYRYYE